uniref:Uncharacterized protein n=1 Tax=Vespula pensylvanica TaxID=30213 RepID=A0A834KCU4_VESPE|nr:hypothetical protein H0235_015115 [Vespula pensylvanica]
MPSVKEGSSLDDFLTPNCGIVNGKTFSKRNCKVELGMLHREADGKDRQRGRKVSSDSDGDGGGDGDDGGGGVGSRSGGGGGGGGGGIGR